MRVLITGASGFIGNHLWRCAPPAWEIWGVYLNAPRGTISSKILRFDLRDAESLTAVVRGVRPSVIIHAAAYSRVSFCEDNPTAAWEMNTVVTEQIAQICARQKIRLVFLSSDMVFDGSQGRYRETDAPNAINFYGQTKLAAEEKILALGADGVVARVNLTYGQPRGGGSSFSEEVIRVVRLGRTYPLFTDQRRSFLSVRNLAEALQEIAGSDFHGIIHLGGTEPADRYTFGLKLARQVGLNRDRLVSSSLQTAPRVHLHPADNTFDVSQAKRLLKTRLLDLEEGLELEYPIKEQALK